jgi:tetratricopeptide (TPR) repeat protein
MPEPISAGVARLIHEANEAAESGDLARAQATAGRAIELAESTFHQPSRAAANYTLAAMLWSDPSASVSEAHTHARQALDLALRFTDEYYLALTLLSRIEAGLGNHPQARRYLEQLQDSYRRKNRQKGLADVLRSFGDLAMKENDLSAARTYFTDGLALYTSTVRDPLNHAGLLLSFGSLAYREGAYEEAGQHWENAARLGEEHRLPQVLSQARQALALLAETTSRQEKSERP